MNVKMFLFCAIPCIIVGAITGYLGLVYVFTFGAAFGIVWGLFFQQIYYELFGYYKLFGTYDSERCKDCECKSKDEESDD